VNPRDLFERADAIFDAALDLPAEDRLAFVESRTGDDAALRDAVLRLIQAHDESGRFLEGAAAEIASSFLTGDTGTIESGYLGAARVGPFRAVHELGQGGMGSVFLGERADGQFSQRVALKFVRGGILSPYLVKRFTEERQILATLEHPGIARLVDGGVTEAGVPWFAMEYVDGEPIDRAAERLELSLKDRLDLFSKVCEAVQYAHEQHIVHRDLKPSNVLVTADKSVKLLDFGIAKILDPGDGASGSVTHTGAGAMTPQYAAPEQIRSEPVTAATDVYALGVLLYELLTGSRPYQVEGRSLRDVERLVCSTAPPPPSSRLRQLRGDLDTIVMKAMHKDPSRRYGSVGALLGDIRRHLNGQAILARRDSAIYRAGRFARRNRGGIVTAALALAAIAVTALVTSRAIVSDDAAITAPPDRLFVADLTSAIDDSVLVRALSEAIRVDIAQFPRVRVLSPQQVAATLQRMEHSRHLAISDSLALELAAREGVKAIVTGDIARVGGQYLLSARLVSATDGDLLGAVREEADSARLMEAVGRMTRGLRRALGESSRSLRGTEPLSRVTTASLPALRAYSEALEATDLRGDRFEAIRLLEQAIAIDTAFAAAHRTIGALYAAQADPGRATESLERAFAHRDRLPLREKYLTMGSYYRNVTRELDKAVAAYQAQIAREPQDVAALNNLALVHAQRGELTEQELLLRRVIAIDTTYPTVYLGLAESLALQSRELEAAAVLDEIDGRFPGHPITPMTRSYVAAAARRWDEAELQIRRRLERGRQQGRPEGDAHQTLGQILLVTGRVDEAENELRAALEIARRDSVPRRALFAAVQLGWLELRHRNRRDRALVVLDSVLDQFPPASLRSGDRPYAELGGLYAAVGAVDRARALLRLSERDSSAADRNSPGVYALRGHVAALSGRHQQAIVRFRESAAVDRCPICSLPALGEAYERVGSVENALASYERYLATPWIWRFETDAPHLAHVLRRVDALRPRTASVAGNSLDGRR
jgi:tetratricopeptide (TPR) repeat protein/predicted Ser/Thr protein kinase/TolB-like protein